MELEGLVNAAFWIGLEHSEDGVRSVVVSADPASFSKEGPELQDLVTLLVQREIDFAVDFQPERGGKVVPSAPAVQRTGAPSHGHQLEAGYLTELAELKRALEEGRLTKSQYEENRKILIAGWIGRAEGRTGGR